MKLYLGILLVLTSVYLVLCQKNQPNRCDLERAVITKTDCTNCRANSRVNCPVGYRKTTRGRGRRGCRYRVTAGGSRRRMARGCQHSCVSRRVEPRCCDNFWGQDCEECPKTSDNGYICNGRGTCLDGINGNGTCRCRGNIAGTACESCALPNQFGPDCEHNCTCVHGLCDSGVERSGRCDCESGFGGASCSIALSDCVSMNCHANARCLMGEGDSLKCLCNPGYVGNGTNCGEFNACLDNTTNQCHAFALCVHRGPAMYDCTCKSGYTGDGRSCFPVDPCQTNNGGCPARTTLCHYTGPGEALCTCKTGYENYTTSGCKLSNLCNVYPNTTCDSRANCSTTDENQIITVKCKCPLGMVSRGLRCYTDILTEIANINNSSGPFQNRLNKAITMLSSNFFYELSFSGPYTVLVPVDDAFGSELGEPDDSVAWRTKAKAHVVAGSVEVDFSQQTATSMFPLLGYNTSIKALRPTTAADVPDDDDSGTFAVLMLNSVISGNILESGKWASNGIFYITDTFLEPPSFPMNYNARNQSIVQALQAIPQTSTFLDFLKKCSKLNGRLRSSNFTLFVPTNDGILSSLTTEEFKLLESPSGLETLNSLLLNLYFPTPLAVMDVGLFNNLIETPSDNVFINVSDNGIVTLGYQQAKVLVSEVPVQGGSYIYLIDKLIVPFWLSRLVNATCIDVTQQQALGPCGDCDRTDQFCDRGGVVAIGAENDASNCVYQATSGDDALGQRLGCRYRCIINITTDVCCSGFYGQECWSCPGPTHKPCNDNGYCIDEKNGNGRCNCEDNFAGDDCSQCASSKHFGRDCDQNCTCLHGVCDSTIGSHGVCRDGTCDAEWSGENCDRRTYPCGSESILCHQHATCVSNVSTDDDGGAERCVCDLGYTGSGTDCVEFNPCIDSDDLGGCDVNAACWYLGKGNFSCRCLQFYTGDGITCEPINPCLAVYTGCHDNGRCMFTGPGQMDCTCNSGYRGNGYICDEINSCLENNGGCHFRARCESSGPGENTCHCRDGFQGDGLQCVGYLLMEIYERPDLTLTKHWVDTYASVRDLFLSVQSSQVTAFLPRDSAWTSLRLPDYHFWVTEEHLPFILRYHMIRMTVPSSNLKFNSQLETLLPSSPISVNNVTVGTNVEDVRGNITISHNIPTLGQRYAKITVPDLQIFNGLVHILDDVLLPPRDVVMDHPLLKDALVNATGTKLDQYSTFIGYLNSSGVLTTLEEAGDPYTIFAVSNEIINQMTIDESEQSRLMFKYHVIPGKLIRLESTKSGQHESTMAGSGYQVTFVRRHAQHLINGQEITDGNIRTKRGIVHGLRSTLLQPVKSNCDRKVLQLQTHECRPCSTFMACNGKASMLAKIPCRQKILPTGPLLNPDGCKPLCMEQLKIPRCCPGFYGPGCEPCLGGVGNVCFNKGTCMDGIKGNGTCTCNDDKFTGPACDECAANLYGTDCHLNCSCVHGKCLDGKMGSGACICEDGYHGAACDKVKDPNDACGGTCNSSSSCVAGRCLCDAGYTGDGSTCTAVNPCDDSASINCHGFASCEYQGPGLHVCKCKDGYQGDGTYCSEVDPCLSGQAPCDENADCMHIGPNLSNCLCREGYSGDGKTCVSVNPCNTGKLIAVFAEDVKVIDLTRGTSSQTTSSLHLLPSASAANGRDVDQGATVPPSRRSSILSMGVRRRSDVTCCNSHTGYFPTTACGNGGCHIFATCKHTGPGTRVCTCFADFVGDGVENCTGDIYSGMIGDESYSSLIFSRTSASVGRLLSTPGAITVFLPPTDSSIFTSSSDFLQRQWLFMSHIVGCESLTTDKLKSLSKIQSLVGNTINISTNGGEAYLNGNISIGEGKTYTNGVVYRINGTLKVPDDLLVETDFVHNSVAEELKKYGAGRFIELLNYTDGIPLLTDLVHESWTLFVPTDDAFDKLYSYKQRQLQTDINVAREYSRYHMVRQSMLMPSDVTTTSDLTTMQGSRIRVDCSPDKVGQILVNQQTKVQAFYWIETILVMQPLISTSIYIIDKVLEPPSVGGRCDIVTNSTIEGTCSLCMGDPMPCPTGMTRVGHKSAKCSAQVASQVGSVAVLRPVSGCRPICSVYNVTSRCCSGYYGNDCHPCPGLPGLICSGHGNCSEGIGGTGKCTCEPGFTGIACELCEANRFGRLCKMCNCTTHGHCSDGIKGSGYCFCEEGWTGQTCSLKIGHPSRCPVNCTDHAICLDNGKCVCEYGYVGDGRYLCETLDLCARNPCSIYATCIPRQYSVTCQCNFPYKGDGYVCTGYDPCHDTSNPVNCHQLARCVYVGPNVTRCQCPPGYHGDGKTSCVFGSDSSRPLPMTCAVNNGGCSLNANCTDSGTITIPRVNCTCKPEYVGDGHVCNGNLYQVFSEGLYNTRKFYQKALRKDILYMIKLRQAKNMTLLVPRDEALKLRRIGRRVLTRHVISGTAYTSADLQDTSSILVDSRTALPVQTTSDGKIFINGVEVVTADIPATNGIIHIMKDVISSRITTITTTTKPVVPVTLPEGVTTPPKTSTLRTTTKSPTSSTTAPAKSEPSSGNITNTSGTNAMTTKKKITSSDKRASSSGVKVGISIAIVALVLIIIGALYCWKRRNGMFVFRPLSERGLLSRSSDIYSDIPASAGMENLAYDSTAFREPTDTHGLFSSSYTASGALDGDEEHEALVAFKATE